MQKPEQVQLAINQREETPQDDILEVLNNIMNPKFSLPFLKEASTINGIEEKENISISLSPYEHFCTNEQTWTEYGCDISIFERELLMKNKKEIEKLSLVRKDSTHYSVLH